MIPSYHPTFSTTPPPKKKRKKQNPPQKKKKKTRKPFLSPHNKKIQNKTLPPKKTTRKNRCFFFPQTKKNTRLDIANSSLLRWSEVNDGPESLSTTWQRKNRFGRIVGEFFGIFLRQKAIDSTSHYIPYHPCMVYLRTFGWFLWLMWGIIPYMDGMGI